MLGSYVSTCFRLFVRLSVCLSLRDSFTPSFTFCNKEFGIFLFPSIHSFSAMKSSNFDFLSTVVSSYFTFFGSLGWLWSFFFFFFFFFFLVWIFPEQPFLTISCTVLSISACCEIFFSNLLEAESRSGYFCSVPLNIITGVVNYILRSGTEQG